MQGLLRFWGTACLLCLTLFFAVCTLAIISNTWLSSKQMPGAHDRVVVIELKGVIYKSSGFTKKIKELLEDKKVKALVVRINSPGGLVGPSQEIYSSLRKAADKIPVVASIGSVGASGGYYAAIGAQKIFANPGSIKASIGVISEFANLEKLYQWAKIERFALKSGKLKDVGSETRKMTPEEREFLTQLLLDIHSDFKTAVQKERKLTPEETDKWTDGRIMTGSQALAAKLIDSVGGMDEAIAEAKVLAKLPADAPVDFPEHNKRNFLRTLLSSDEEESLTGDAWQSLKFYFSQLADGRGWRVWLLAPVS